MTYKLPEMTPVDKAYFNIVEALSHTVATNNIDQFEKTIDFFCNHDEEPLNSVVAYRLLDALRAVENKLADQDYQKVGGDEAFPDNNPAIDVL